MSTKHLKEGKELVELDFFLGSVIFHLHYVMYMVAIISFIHWQNDTEEPSKWWKAGFPWLFSCSLLICRIFLSRRKLESGKKQHDHVAWNVHTTAKKYIIFYMKSCELWPCLKEGRKRQREWNSFVWVLVLSSFFCVYDDGIAQVG